MNDHKPRPDNAATVVVGIGASAGGVEALSSFFGNERLPTDAAFLVVMHLAANRESQLPQILTRHTTMPVQLAANGMPIEQAHVYVIPAGQSMTVRDGRLQLTPANLTDRIPTVVDRLFNSLAETYAECAIGVVLSGTGTDGALGLKAIKERGGLTVAQVPDGSAPLFSGMPQNAIAAGVVDLQLPVEQIADRLADEISTMERPGAVLSADAVAQREHMRLEICALVQKQLGHDFSGYKPSTFHRRVQRRMQVLRLTDMDAYVDRLRHDPEEVSLLLRDLLISVTSFFRDEDAFGVLEQQVIPALFKDKDAQEEVRVWVPGCATGEEPYSLGMLLLEHADRLGAQSPAIRIFATDIDERALGIARKARYPSVLLEGLSEERRQRFFVEDRGHYTVQKRLREICTFSPHNALRDPPFSRIDLVSCRNLLIYLGPEFQDRILPILHYALRPEGFLFMGIAEGATRHGTLFASVSKPHRIFQRLPSPPGSTTLPPPLAAGSRAAPPVLASTHGSGSGSHLRQQIEARMLRSHVPPYVLVNGHGDAMFYSGRTGNYLEFPTGTPSLNLFTNARKELRLGLRRALHDVISSQVRIDLPEMTIPCEDSLRRVQISIDPFEDGESPLYLVLFNDRGEATPAPEDGKLVGNPTLEQMERDLRETREQLQATYEEFETAIEELRVTNEELMSVNEELQSSNEEMETSKEELQSVNEELHTVNNEMAQHVEALDQSNADLRGLLESTAIATIFLDRQLAIRSFTQAATEIFTLIPSDRGRTITDLTHQLDDFDLRESLETTLVRKQLVQVAVGRKDGSKHYLMRMLPYAGMAEETGGVVLTFVDVTALTKADARHQTMIGELNHRVRNMLAVVGAMARQTLVQSVEGDTLDAFHNRLHAMARTYKLLTETNWSSMSFGELVRAELSVVAGSTRYSIDGPLLQLAPGEALALGMIAHELATNAVKYGALSNDHGRVDVRWEFAEGGESRVTIHWIESGGPPVIPSTHRGFGTLLIERQLAYELGGHSSITSAPEGLQVTMQIPREPSA